MTSPSLSLSIKLTSLYNNNSNNMIIKNLINNMMGILSKQEENTLSFKN